jgi:hypothetical protein
MEGGGILRIEGDSLFPMVSHHKGVCNEILGALVLAVSRQDDAMPPVAITVVVVKLLRLTDQSQSFLHVRLLGIFWRGSRLCDPRGGAETLWYTAEVNRPSSKFQVCVPERL